MQETGANILIIICFFTIGMEKDVEGHKSATSDELRAASEVTLNSIKNEGKE